MSGNRFGYPTLSVDLDFVKHFGSSIEHRPMKSVHENLLLLCRPKLSLGVGSSLGGLNRQEPDPPTDLLVHQLAELNGSLFGSLSARSQPSALPYQ